MGFIMGIIMGNIIIIIIINIKVSLAEVQIPCCYPRSFTSHKGARKFYLISDTMYFIDPIPIS